MVYTVCTSLLWCTYLVYIKYTSSKISFCHLRLMYTICIYQHCFRDMLYTVCILHTLINFVMYTSCIHHSCIKTVVYNFCIHSLSQIPKYNFTSRVIYTSKPYIVSGFQHEVYFILSTLPKLSDM